MCFALVDLSELLNTRNLDAAAIFEDVLKVGQVNLLGFDFFVIGGMTPLELDSVGLAYYLGEYPLSREHL